MNITKYMVKKDEIIIMAPIQVKKILSPGNIYDLIVVDFYAKVRRLCGIKVRLPLFWNVNGLPIIRMIQKDGLAISKENIEIFANRCIKDGLSSLRRYGVDLFHEQLRDDQINGLVSNFIDSHYKPYLHKGQIPIATCTKCDLDFGTDSDIATCKICGGAVAMKVLSVLYQEISKSEISKKIANINIYPKGTQKELISFNKGMPDKYNICLTKKREYTLSYDGYDLDPRFIVMLTPALISGEFSRRIYIHGDIIKKFSYYSLCHLPVGFLPTDILCHGVLLDSHGRKIRWQDQDINVARMFNDLPPSELRAFFLKRNVAKDIVLDFDSIKESLREQRILRDRIDRLLVLQDSPRLSEKFIRLKSEFLQASSDFFYGVAYDKMLLIVKLLETNLPAMSIHPTEKAFLNELRFLYFGQYHGIKNQT
jgi:hypothetical protein